MSRIKGSLIYCVAALIFGEMLNWSAAAPVQGAHQQTDMLDRVNQQFNDQSTNSPNTVDPLFYTEQKVAAADGAASDYFGYSVAVEGNTALVGAYGSDAAHPDQGAAYVYTRSGVTWVIQQKLTAPDGMEGDRFGGSVALQGDTALVSAISTNYDQSSVYVFTRSGTTWSMQQKLAAPDGPTYRAFGVSVALSGDTALVGAYNDPVGGQIDQGSAYVFTRNGAVWTFQQKLIAPDGTAYDYFGKSVALDENTALVGAYQNNAVGKIAAGSAYVFTRNGSIWTIEQKLTAVDGATGDWFGYSVALEDDSVLVGAPFDDVGVNSDQGSAYVFTRSGMTWSQQQKLTVPDGTAFVYFGTSIAISGDSALIGAPSKAVGGNPAQGSVYIFTRSGYIWKMRQKLIAADGEAFDFLGSAVALSGNTALGGANGDDFDPDYISQGSAYFFEFRYPFYLPWVLFYAP